MDYNFSYSNINKSEINFSIKDKASLNFNYETKKSNFQTTNDKGKLPINNIFRINSLFFNEEKQIEEIYNKYDCLYNNINNILYLIINKNFNYANFTKDKLLHLLEFSISLGIDKLYLLISKTNSKYLNIIQDMKIVGFRFEDNSYKISIDGNEYKILKMNIKDICEEIKEITLI